MEACDPLVTTDLGGLREATFAPNWCIPADDIDALADALAAAFGSPTDGEDPRRKVLERHAPVAAGEIFLRWVAKTVL